MLIAAPLSQTLLRAKRAGLDLSRLFDEGGLEIGTCHQLAFQQAEFDPEDIQVHFPVQEAEMSVTGRKFLERSSCRTHALLSVEDLAALFYAQAAIPPWGQLRKEKIFIAFPGIMLVKEGCEYIPVLHKTSALWKADIRPLEGPWYFDHAVARIPL